MITSEEIKILEKEAVKRGVPTLELMENAGKKVAEIIEQKKDIKNKRILVVAYHGNNGGDGFVAANYLSEKADVEILFVGDEAKLKIEAEINYKKVEENPLIQFISLDYVDFNDYEVIIDAMLGTGIKGNLIPILQSTIMKINESKAFKVSIDIPSGMDPDNGNVEDVSVNPDLIITFHDLKKGLENLKEKTVVVDIGIPKF